LTNKQTTEKVIETASIRLTADETRAIMKAAASSHPISDYRCCGLVDLGIMAKVEIKPQDTTKERAELWRKIAKAAPRKDDDAIRDSLRTLSNLDNSERKKETGYVLTPLGKSVARGVRVSLNGQYKQVPC